MPDMRCRKLRAVRSAASRLRPGPVTSATSSPWHHLLAVAGVGDELDGRIDAVKHRLGHRQPGDHPRSLDDHLTGQAEVYWQRGFARRIPATNVLGHRELYQRRRRLCYL